MAVATLAAKTKPETEERPAHWFKPGESGNAGGAGRAAQKYYHLKSLIAEHALTDFDDDPRDKDWRPCVMTALDEVYQADKVAYLQIVVKVLPKDINLTADDAILTTWAAMIEKTDQLMSKRRIEAKGVEDGNNDPKPAEEGISADTPIG